MTCLESDVAHLFACSLTARPGGDDGPGRLERPPFLRIPEVENGPLDTSTPQGEEMPSPIGSQSSSNLVFKQSRF